VEGFLGRLCLEVHKEGGASRRNPRGLHEPTHGFEKQFRAPATKRIHDDSQVHFFSAFQGMAQSRMALTTAVVGDGGKRLKAGSTL